MSFALLLTFFKQPLGVGVYFNIISLAIGLYRYLTIYVYPSTYFYLFLFLSIGLIGAVLDGSDLGQSYYRVFQVLLLMGFSLWFRTHINTLDKSFFLLVICFTVLVFILEYYVGVRYVREYMGLVVPRFSGMHGEPNYNSILLASLAIIALSRYKQLNYIVVSLILLSLAGFSRGAVLGLLIFFLYYFMYPRYKSLTYLACNVLIVSLFLQPIVLLVFSEFASSDLISAVNEVSSNRIAHWLAYTEIALDNWMGVGFYQAQGLEVKYINYELFPQLKPQQAHSMYFSTLADFGFLGYGILFSIFISASVRMKNSRLGGGVILFLLTSFSTLNVFGEISFWMLMSFLYSRSKF